MNMTTMMLGLACVVANKIYDSTFYIRVTKFQVVCAAIRNFHKQQNSLPMFKWPYMHGQPQDESDLIFECELSDERINEEARAILRRNNL